MALMGMQEPENDLWRSVRFCPSHSSATKHTQTWPSYFSMCPWQHRIWSFALLCRESRPPPPPWRAVLDALVSCGLHNLANPQNSTSPQLLILLKPDSLLVTETQGFNFIFFPPQRLFKLQCPPFLEARKWSSEHICQCHEQNLSESVFAWASVYDRGLLDKISSSQQAERRVFLLDCLSFSTPASFLNYLFIFLKEPWM